MSEFEKTYEYEKERWAEEFEDGDYYTLSDVMETVNNLKSAHNADMAQLYDNCHYTGLCSCTCNLMSYMGYYPNCGAKLNWTEVEK